jgi:parallel beta-helix repeat protein
MMPSASRLLAAVCLISILLTSSVSAGGGNRRVKAGQSIQAAIKAARRNDRIVVEAGTYAEQLTIKKDGIVLVGLGAILVPPATPPTTPVNDCSGLAGPGTEAGICVQGSGLELANFTQEHRKVLKVGSPVKDVTIKGFDVRGFSGENIALVGAKDATVTGNTLTDGGQYGCLTAGSKGNRVAGNTVSSSTLGFIGICMDDFANVQVANNKITSYIIGLCIQTDGADVRGNDVSNVCLGAFVDPLVNGAQVHDNHVGATNPVCPSIPGVGIYGIIVNGAINTEIKNNRVEGQTDNGKDPFQGAGIAIFDNPFPPDPPVDIATGNVITENILKNNDLDILVFTNGTGNVVKRNLCKTSFPEGLCA